MLTDAEVAQFSEVVRGLPRLAILWAGTVASEQELRHLVEHHASRPSSCGGEREGIIVRFADAYSGARWERSIAKWVRASHIQREPDVSRRNGIL